jgi:hypothetical protein
MSRERPRRLAHAIALVLLALAAAPNVASATEAPQWHLEQPPPPPPKPGVERSPVPVGLGHVGDIAFLERNLALLSTRGNGDTIKPGVWAYNGAGWHEIASECGATDGRVAWAGPEDFWTVSDGRPGQASNSEGLLPPLEDNTLCHFVGLAKVNQHPGELGASIVGSYASLAFSPASYQPMHAAACIDANDCWFGGDPLPEPQHGAFQLHWSGAGVQAEPNTTINAVAEMRAFEGSLISSVSLPLKAPPGEHTPEELLHPTILTRIAPAGTAPTFGAVRLGSAGEEPVPVYAPGSFPAALGPLHLSASEGTLWAAAGSARVPPERSAPGMLTVLRHTGGSIDQGWSEVLGPASDKAREEKSEGPPPEDVVTSVAAEPGGSSAWLALDSGQDAYNTSPNSNALALVGHVTATGSLTLEELPTRAEREKGVGGKGAAALITCPAQNDCWLVTTQGWLFHLAEPQVREHPIVNPDPAIEGPLITFRPPDEGIPQVQNDTQLADTSGLGEAPPLSQVIKPEVQEPAMISVPLVSHLHVRLVHGTTLELSFQLAVKARVRLLARRHKSVVASTPTLTLGSGKRKLDLRLNLHRWPTKLDLQTRPLAALPTISTRGAAVETVGTSLAFPRTRGLLGTGP